MIHDEDKDFAILCTVMKFWSQQKLLEVGEKAFGRELQAIQRELKYREDNHVRL